MIFRNILGNVDECLFNIYLDNNIWIGLLHDGGGVDYLTAPQE